MKLKHLKLVASCFLNHILKTNCKHCAYAHNAKVLSPFFSLASIYNVNKVHNNMFVLILDPCFNSFDYMKALVGKVKAIKMIAKHDVQHNFDALFVGYFLIPQSWYYWPCSNSNLYYSGFNFQNNGCCTCDINTTCLYPIAFMSSSKTTNCQPFTCKKTFEKRFPNFSFVSQ